MHARSGTMLGADVDIDRECALLPEMLGGADETVGVELGLE